MQSINVFVYGTLKPDETSYFLCRDSVISAVPAIVRAALYHLPLGYPAIVPGNAATYGYLLSFNDRAILEILDDYEQHDPETIALFGLDNNYDRKEIEVFALNGDFIGLAWAYVMTLDQVDRLDGIPAPDGIWQSKK
ncbi:gamma-glutamylcyclotransferase family protein [Leptolyngbya sp. FACHB-17]|uniref:gamma-glutamylcyclotransferase family protein n=1 Tax=unclassified Leptolyngbya TaxID=2650499 RepID=UPI001680F41E|nr:gamma-glutamylcyclotransferase family protein [Leptolyngbya sp. FACHB-17]MBD2081218.1 gamma-glutamylcyclotransferase [Leptolyngbya sp. FACHB-17]